MFLLWYLFLFCFVCNSCEGHGMYDAVLDDLPLPAELINNFDVNGDGVINNIEFYEAADPTKEGGMNYIFDHFTWNHCELAEEVDEEPETLYATGLSPTRWAGAAYKDLKMNTVKPKQSIAVHREQVEAGLKPGKDLKKMAKYPGSVEDFNAIMSLLEQNEKN